MQNWLEFGNIFNASMFIGAFIVGLLHQDGRQKGFDAQAAFDFVTLISLIYAAVFLLALSIKLESLIPRSNVPFLIATIALIRPIELAISKIKFTNRIMQYCKKHFVKKRK
ncbi:MAG: hypothetical protein ACR2NY_00915 [Alphaproteobacteria bacterium]